VNLLYNKNYIHLFFISLLAIHYVVPLIVIGQVVVNPFDNLDGGFVYDHIISKIYRGDFESISYFLSGTIKWYYLEEIFYPTNILHYFLNDKLFYFSDEISKKLFAYFSFYLLAKSLGNTKFNSALGGILYSTIANTHLPLGLGLVLLPYILYLLLNKNLLNKKHYLFLFLIGLNSSLIQDFFSIILLIPLSFILKSERKNLKIYFQVFSTIIIALILSNIHLVMGSILFDPTHRSSFDALWSSGSFGNNIISLFAASFQNFFTYGDPTNILFIFNAPLTILTVIVFFLSFFSKQKNVRMLSFFIIFILILRSLVNHNIIDNILIGILDIFKGFSFERLDRIIPVTFTLLFVLFILSLKNIKFKKFLYLITFLSILSMQLKTPLPIIGESFLKANMNLKEYNRAKSALLNTKYNEFFGIIFSKKNYHSKKIDFKNSVSKTFDNYYKFDDYLFIKNIVKNQRVMSVGLDPMIAVMNDIKVIDGYHTLYPLSYKFKFRKIIEKELEKNTVLKNYYDSWGSRVYAFYNNQNNIMLNFQAAKKIGADYVISKFPIENNELEKVCSECNGSNEIFLYKIL